MRWALFFLFALGLGALVARRTGESLDRVKQGPEPITSQRGGFHWYALLYGAGAVFYVIARASAGPEEGPMDVQKG